MLRLNNIIKSAKNRRILTDINIEFEDKGLYLIKGESGSGKSTLLNIIAGIDSDYKGKIEVDGKRLKRNPSSYRKNYVSFMSNDYDLIDNLTIKENFDLLQEMYGFKSDEVDVILKSFKLDINLNQKISELSGGQRQRVMVG